MIIWFKIIKSRPNLLGPMLNHERTAITDIFQKAELNFTFRSKPEWPAQ